jgi:hypothetical protein
MNQPDGFHGQKYAEIAEVKLQVADLKLRTSEKIAIAELVAEQRFFKEKLRNCDCGSASFKLQNCDCGLKKKLRVPTSGLFPLLGVNSNQQTRGAYFGKHATSPQGGRKCRPLSPGG